MVKENKNIGLSPHAQNFHPESFTENQTFMNADQEKLKNEARYSLYFIGHLLTVTKPGPFTPSQVGTGLTT